MILGNTSFVTAWLLLKGNIRSVIRNGEVRVMAILIPISMAALFLFTTQSVYPQLGKAVRVAVFESITALTTTGYSTVSYTGWGSFGWLMLIGLMLIGGGTSSTAGGIKQFRAYLMAKAVGWEVKRMLLPRSVLIERPIWEGNQRTFVDDGRVRQVATFVFLYLFLLFSGSLILTASGYSISDSIFEFASAIGTVGLSVGVTSATMPDAALWAEIVAMYVGRLEIFVVIAGVWTIGRDCHLMISSGARKRHHA
jgi:trk system potassium uptake protein TrkH